MAHVPLRVGRTTSAPSIACFRVLKGVNGFIWALNTGRWYPSLQINQAPIESFARIAQPPFCPSQVHLHSGGWAWQCFLEEALLGIGSSFFQNMCYLSKHVLFRNCSYLSSSYHAAIWVPVYGLL